MKFWAVNGAEVRNNWIHDNRGPGVWADTNNNNFLIENNLIESNDDMGIFYEISYNAVVRGNTLRNNAWVVGREFAGRGDTFPIGAIYLSEAGGDSRLPASTSRVEVVGNTFTNNWGGVVGWENSDRFCNSPASTTDDCTLIVGPTNTTRCSQPAISAEPLRSDCRWRTQNLDIHHNTFAFDPAKVAGGCPTAYCGRSAIFANYGTYPDWSPYKGRVVQDAITFRQSNRWHDNTYTGPWRFVPYETGRDMTLAQWQAAPYNQDAGSTG
jgi:parallel beta-helix repeat protein